MAFVSRSRACRLRRRAGLFAEWALEARGSCCTDVSSEFELESSLQPKFAHLIRSFGKVPVQRDTYYNPVKIWD